MGIGREPEREREKESISLVITYKESFECVITNLHT